MKITATVSMKSSTADEFITRTFPIEIPDDIIEAYARRVLELMDEDEALEYVNDNPPDNTDDYEDEP